MFLKFTFVGILAKMKEGAETVQTKIQAKAESVLKQGGEFNKGELFFDFFIYLHVLWIQIM